MAAFGSFIALRLLLAFSPIPNYLKNNHQLTSPLTSYTRLKEGVFLFQNGLEPYAGGLFRHSPLQLAFFSTTTPLTKDERALQLFWTAVDAFTAWNVVRIWRARSAIPNPRREALIQACYLLNPYLMFPSLALSTTTLDNALIVLVVLMACQRKKHISLLLLALLTHSSLYSALLLPPVALVLQFGPRSGLKKPNPVTGWSKLATSALEFTLYTALIALLSTIVAGNLLWIKETWGATLTVPDLTPNVGLWWYFFTEMFDHFRTFFLMVFSALVAIAVVPLTIKFQHDPLYATFLVIGNVAIFKSYPTMADSGLFLTLMTLFPEVYPHLRHPLPTVMWHVYASTLLPLFNNLWLGEGTGNSNFFYAATLVFGVANGAAILDAIWAGLIVPYGHQKEGIHLIHI